LALSPDGRQLAFVAATGVGPRLWVRTLDQTAARPSPGTDGASFPFWAPDGRAVGFFADGKLKRMDLTGGAPQTIADAPAGRGGTWSEDGMILFAPTNASGLMRVPSTGGTPTAVTQFGSPQGSHRWPQFLPDGRQFLFLALGGSTETRGVYLGSLDGADPVRLVAAESAAVYAPPNSLLLVREGTLTALPFDPTRAVISGDPAPVAQAVGSDPTQGRGTFSVSAAGVMTYLSGSGSQLRQLVWRDRTGRVLGRVGQPDDTNIGSIALAPDGRRIAMARTTQGNQDVWLIDVNRGVPSRFTFDAGGDNAPAWSSDGQRVVFRSNRNGTFDLFEKPASGAGDEQPLLVTPELKIAYDSSADGRTLLYGTLNAKTGADIWALPLTGDRKPFPVVRTSFAEDSAQFSPDGEWVAYESNETGRFEIYAQAFPTARGKWQVSTGGGVHPRWRPNGRELFYLVPDGRLMAASLAVGSDGQSLEAGTPVALFTPRLASGGTILSPGALARPLYAVAADGRFLVNEAAEDTATTPLTIILNWDAEIR
jgi:Tol biopolymer transport system component